MSSEKAQDDTTFTDVASDGHNLKPVETTTDDVAPEVIGMLFLMLDVAREEY